MLAPKTYGLALIQLSAGGRNNAPAWCHTFAVIKQLEKFDPPRC